MPRRFRSLGHAPRLHFKIFMGKAMGISDDAEEQEYRIGLRRLLFFFFFWGPHQDTATI